MTLENAGEAGLLEACGAHPGRRAIFPRYRWLKLMLSIIFGYFSKMVNNLSEFKLTVATGGMLEEIKIPGSNDGDCRGRQEVIDKWGYRK